MHDKNLTPMLGVGISPSQIMLGRNNLLESLESAQWVESKNESDLNHTMQHQIQSAMHARNAVIMDDSRRVVRLGLNRKIRAGASQDFKLDDVVQIFIREEGTKIERWIHGFRVVGLTSHHVIVERADKLFKHPKHKVRIGMHEEGVDKPVTEEKSSSSAATQFVLNGDMEKCSRYQTLNDGVTSRRIMCGTEGIDLTANPCGKYSVECADHNYMSDAKAECVSAKWIMAMSSKNENLFQEEFALEDKADNSLEEEENQSLMGADMNRITPKYFLKCPRALAAIKKEILGLLKIHNGKAALELTTERDERWTYNKRVYSMIVMKRKSTLEFKARLVLRGDTVSEQDMAFTSAPTACLGSVATLITLNVIFGLSLHMVDISQAFLQADELVDGDKMITTVPPYVLLPDAGKLDKCPVSGMPIVNEKDLTVLDFETYQQIPMEKKRASFRRCLITHRPLYGGRDAPLRWFLRLAAALRKGGWRNTRCDVCTFTRHSRNLQGEVDALTSMIIVHVDDLLITTNAADLKRLKLVLSQFKTGPIFALDEEKKLEYLGLEIQLGKSGQIGLHQSKYIADLQCISIEEVVKNKDWVISKEKWITLMKRLIGSLIWIGQTRFDITSVTTVLSTTMKYAVNDTEKAVSLLKLFNKTVRALKSNVEVISYRRFLPEIKPTVQQILSQCSLFTFTDAGFGCLEGGYSTEAAIIAFGIAFKKETAIEAHACLLWSQARKIHRVARSSLACEVLSISNGVDLSIWYQQYMFELLTAQFHCDTLSPSDTLPLLNPFVFGRTGTNLSGINEDEGAKQVDRFDAGEEAKVVHNVVVRSQSCNAKGEANQPAQTLELNARRKEKTVVQAYYINDRFSSTTGSKDRSSASEDRRKKKHVWRVHYSHDRFPTTFHGNQELSAGDDNPIWKVRAFSLPTDVTGGCTSILTSSKKEDAQGITERSQAESDRLSAESYNIDRFPTTIKEISSMNKVDESLQDQQIEFISYCKTCSHSSTMDLSRVRSDYSSICMIDPVRWRVKSVIFTDCANAYSSISNVTASSSDKAMRLHLAYIRDNAATNILSFCDAIFNMADLGTKLSASSANWRKFLQTGIFRVSFLGRKAALSLFQDIGRNA